MDVAKYIGLFLFKNNFCYIHGLGNLELKKKPASYSGDELKGSSYEVQLTPTGSIDDNLANFIATNEQISISKASNSLRDFSTQARADLQAGKEVPIPAIGKFIEERGKIHFITDPHLQYTPPAIPSMRVAKRAEDTYINPSEQPPTRPMVQEEEDVSESGSISWVKVGMWAGGLIILLVALFFGVRHMRNQDNTTQTPLIETPDTTVAAPASEAPAGNTGMQDTTVIRGTGVTEPSSPISFDVILNTYTDLGKADKRMQKLKSFGNKVQLVAEEDSSAFYVVLPVQNVMPADTTRLLDSLKRVFNPMGVQILQ